MYVIFWTIIHSGGLHQLVLSQAQRSTQESQFNHPVEPGNVGLKSDLQVILKFVSSINKNRVWSHKILKETGIFI